MSISMEKYPQLASSSSSSSPSSHHHPPWLDLPPHLTELIPQRLPLADHIRFGAVCSKWRSIIQQDQQPPMLKLPWIISIEDKLDDSIACFNPFEQKFRLFHFTIGPQKLILGDAHGWLLLLERNLSPIPLHLANPVSGSTIKLPDLFNPARPSIGFVSSSPTNADCTVIVSASLRSFLWRRGDPNWTQLPGMLGWSYIREGVFCGKMFYCMCSDNRFYFVDLAQSLPSLQLLDMDHSEISPYMLEKGGLVESNGEVLFVQAIKEDDENRLLRVVGFRVFRADLVRRLWVRIESLGDRVLFVSPSCSFSSLAAEAGVGENCIYFAPYLFESSKDSSSPWRWKGFELRSRRMIDGGPALPNVATGYASSRYRCGARWFVPNLDVLDPCAATADGMI